jgi:hypothetical protein
MKMLFELHSRPPCRVILCTCVLKRHEKGQFDKCGFWLCICGNDMTRKGFKSQDGRAECLQCHREFEVKSGLEIQRESQLRLEANNAG